MTSPRPGITAISITKGDTTFNVHGTNAGTQGVYLAKGQVHNLWYGPVKTTYKSGAFQTGARFRYAKRLAWDINLGFHIKECETAWEFNDSAFAQLFSYEPDEYDPNGAPTTITVETELSGSRSLDVLMYEQPDFAPDLDPLAQEYGNVILKLRAPDPAWYEPEALSVMADGFVTVENPTDLKMYHQWVLGPGTWTLPDYSWEGPKGARVPGGAYADRVVDGIEITAENGGAVISIDKGMLQYRDLNNTNLQAQVGGVKIFNHEIPPYTPPTQLPVSGGSTCTLVMPRRWSRPWGLALNEGSGS